MTPARERALAALLCAAGAGLTLLAAGRAWAHVRAAGAITPFTLELTGRDLGGAAGALGWAGLAGLAALFATRGKVRTGVGVLLAAFGAAIGYASVASVRTAHVLDAAADKSALLRLAANPSADVTLWWAVSLAGGALLLAAGSATILRGARWPGMSMRYERPAAAATRTPPETDDPSSLWKSLDRGEDPTEPAPGDVPSSRQTSQEDSQADSQEDSQEARRGRSERS
ncbi:membrane protein [Actinomadura rubrobrunea]|uniref:Membrane protein n=1 Tax=Actinomadura rubrobrunea TaxID=115335 RepID=A0A9W6PUE3_9ACTN|nr:Trp biosynthesis-associated membrane protein [Actinomadura rubrobrunea]GLW63208.1 membrane protein [Actinomadura rubrobrunea]